MTRPKLLLADDSVTIRKVVELTFADEGIDVTTVADGAAAMSKFVETQPNIVLVDAGLPGTSGYQICEMIKADESTSHIPVLLLVGSFEPFDQDAAERGGADGFLTKPFHSIRDLVNRVHELLGTGSGADAVDDDAAVTEAYSVSPENDNDDIDRLIEQSFSETVPVESYETEPAFANEATISDEREPTEVTAGPRNLADEVWLDDDMIEAVSVEGTELEDPVGSVVRYDDTPAAALDAGYDAHEQTDEAETYTADAAEHVNVAPAESEQKAGDDLDEPLDDVRVQSSPSQEFDWSPAAIVTEAEPNESPATDHVTEEYPDLSTHEIPELNAYGQHRATDLSAAGNGTQPSDELVELIARRVIERLSDKAIREVAQEAVPRIAEKLMREALEEERRK